MNAGTELALAACIMRIRNIILPIIFSVLFSDAALAQYREIQKDSTAPASDSLSYGLSAPKTPYFPRPIKNELPPQLFVPSDRLEGLTRWMAAPMLRPQIHVMPVYGFSGYGFGKFSVDHWDKFFGNLLSFNQLNVPQLLDSQVMMVGNTISLGKKRRLYFANGILYGRHYGTWGNMIGMGSREGLIFRPDDNLVIAVWSQEYQSVYAFSPVVYPVAGENAPYVKLPASPLMISYGAQAYFLAGQFWIGLGATLWTASRSVE